jgi:hypothetical protein
MGGGVSTAPIGAAPHDQPLNLPLNSGIPPLGIASFPDQVTMAHGSHAGMATCCS